ncbi:MAG: hypothetical protein Q4E75_05110 [bacterium]|nr:hypothetical protein [bacterium]
MYYLFIIKDNFFKDNSEYLYDILYKLKTMHKENYNYGISLYYSICKLFDVASLKRYIKLKTNLKSINNKFYLDRYNYFELRKSCCIINNDKYLKEVLCIFYIYNKNIFVCNFDFKEYFWLNDKFK